jgi:hypothetical protein
MSADHAAPMTLPQSSAEETGRLHTVRRLYFYLVALISSTVGLFAVGELLSALAESWITAPSVAVLQGEAFARRSIALSAGLLVVTTPLFLLHWRAIGSWLDEPGEREAGMRKFFLYAASAIALGVLAVQSAHLIEGLARLALGQPALLSSILPSEWLQDIGLAVVAGGLLFYWQWVARQDGDYGRERGMALVWRRLFLAAVTGSGLALLIFGSATLLNALLQRLLEVVTPTISSNWFAPAAATGIAQLLVGAMLARAGRQCWQAAARINPAEESSTIRRIFLYVAVIGGALATLIPVANMLRDLLNWTFTGFASPWVEVANGLITPLSFLPAGLLVWRSYAARLRELESQEAARSPASQATGDAAAATVRRIYHYAVAATGLILLWVGATNVVQVLLDLWLTNRAVVGDPVWQLPLATGLSLVAVGAPVWAVHWRQVQGIARKETAEGAAERSSLPRRIYLYGVSLAGALVILNFLARVLYRFFLVLMGDSSIEILSPELAEDLARSAIAALLWAVHLAALRSDMRQAGDPASADAARRRQQLEERIAALESEAAHLRAELATLEPTPPAAPADEAPPA